MNKVRVRIKSFSRSNDRQYLRAEAVSPRGKVIGSLVVKQEVRGVSGGGKVVGNWKVERIEVEQRWRKRGVGTKLYETAAKAIEREHGMGLCSDIALTPEAEGFWKKQILKGRAWSRDRGGKPQYCLKLPVPPSLGAPKDRLVRI